MVAPLSGEFLACRSSLALGQKLGNHGMHSVLPGYLFQVVHDLLTSCSHGHPTSLSSFHHLPNR